MSFAREVKSELLKQSSNARHCRIAELAAITQLCVTADMTQESGLVFTSENISAAQRYVLLIKKLFGIEYEIAVGRNPLYGKKKLYSVTIDDRAACEKLLETIKMDRIDAANHIHVANLAAQQQCCRRAFIRGAFIAAGSISDPEKSYHFEIVVHDMQQAEQLEKIINSFSLDSKIILRKGKYHVVYVKEGSQIVDLLNIMEAHVSMMNLENIRIMKEMRNAVNRKVNCEAANINKTVVASSKQIEDIELIKEKRGLEKLAEGLRDVAYLRITYPEASLKELGDMLSPPVGRSGVNHRLKKLSQIAESLRG